MSKKKRLEKRAIGISQDPNQPIRQPVAGARKEHNAPQVLSHPVTGFCRRSASIEAKPAITNLGDLLIQALWNRDE